ncbi:MAG: methionyl-tRNA formyltransferase, partial [Clostridia bacterium]|nr:methionyl-tRNA formyltransferase [Clostridia bacterium]
RLVRGVNPWPGGWAEMPSGTLKIWKAAALEGDFEGLPGQVVVSDAKKGLVVKCGRGALMLEEIQAPAAKRMNAKAYLMGKSIPVGTVLNEK